MANYNKVILVGNLTRDPQLSYLPSQTAVVEVGLAVNRRYTSNGEKREETCFIDCRAYGRQAEIINQYMSKGQPMLVEGRLQFDTWEGKDGQRRSKHRVVIENFQFLGSAGQGGGGGGGGGGGYRQQQSRPPQQRGGGGGGGGPQGGSYSYDDEPPPTEYDAPGGDDIPF